MSKSQVTTVTNVGALFTGDLVAPVMEPADIRIENGLITAIGSTDSDRGTVIDAQGMTVAPNLIDSHSHVLFGDYTPRQTAVGFLAKYVHGAVGQVVSAGEIHIPDRPRDPASVKGLAMLACASWRNHRPGGMKVNAGVVLLTSGLTDEDFTELTERGVTLAKFGFSDYRDPAVATEDVRRAQRHGLVVVAHSGGPTAKDGIAVDADLLLQLRPDVAGHVNGGPTSLDDDGVRRLVTETSMKLQLVQAGNLRSALLIVDAAREAGAESRIILGTDTPTGVGVMPLGLLKTVAEISSLGSVPPPMAWAWASGSVADTFRLRGGRIAVGQPADLCIVDAPLGSVGSNAEASLARGDIPAVALVMIDGTVHVNPSDYSPRPRRTVKITSSG